MHGGGLFRQGFAGACDTVSTAAELRSGLALLRSYSRYALTRRACKQCPMSRVRFWSHVLKRDRCEEEGRGTREPAVQEETGGAGFVCLAEQRLGGGMIALYKYIREVNSRQGGELFRRKDNAGTRTNGEELARNKIRLGIRGRFLTPGAGMFWKHLPRGARGRKSAEMGHGCFMNGRRRRSQARGLATQEVPSRQAPCAAV